MVEIKNLSVVRNGATPALDSVSFRVPRGTHCAVLGANGAGKTTLLWAIMGLLPLSAGEIFVDKIRVERRNARQIRRKAALVFQNPDDQLFFPTVIEDVMFGLLNRGESEESARVCAEKLLADFDIFHLAERRPQELSDGEKKKAAICSALICSPDILLMDEPSALLDPRSRRECAQMLARLSPTVLLSTHDLDFAAKTCQYSAVLSNGKLAAFGKTAEILDDEELLVASTLM